MGQKIKNFFVFGKIIIVIWIIISIYFTWLILNKITPKEVDLGDFKCSRATYRECVESVIKPRAKDAIQNDLIDILGNIKKVRAIFRLPLEIVDFEIILVDKDSELQLEISSPEYKESLLNLDLECIFVDKNISLKNKTKRSTGEYLRLNNLDEDNIENVAENIASKFNGCDWIPKGEVYVSSQTKKEVAPDGIVSVKKVMKPRLAFQTGLLEKISIFLGFFTIIGGLLALIRQMFQLYRKGINYFVE